MVYTLLLSLGICPCLFEDRECQFIAETAQQVETISSGHEKDPTCTIFCACPCSSTHPPVVERIAILNLNFELPYNDEVPSDHYLKIYKYQDFQPILDPPRLS